MGFALRNRMDGKIIFDKGPAKASCNREYPASHNRKSVEQTNLIWTKPLVAALRHKIVFLFA